MRIERFHLGDAQAVHEAAGLQFLAEDTTDSIAKPLQKKNSTCPGGTLRIFVMQGPEWIEFKPDLSKGFFTIGSGDDDNIIISDEPGVQKQHIAVRYAGKSWFIVERAEKSILLVNNVRKRQATLKEQSSCVLQFGSFVILMTTNTSTLREKLEASGKSFKITTEDSVYRFNSGKTVLVGSSPICDVITKGNPFQGIIFSSAGVHFFYSIAGFCFVTGETRSKVPMALPEQGRTEGMSIEFPTGMQPVNYLYQVQTKSNPSYFILTEIIDAGILGAKTILPPNGHSVAVGRGKDNYMVVDSSRISRHHAQIMTSSTNIIVTDCESTNGTFINDEKISRKIVSPGDIISFSGSDFILLYNEQ